MNQEPLFIASPRKSKNARYEDKFAVQCVSRKLPKFERQYSYAAILGRRFAADFCFVDYKILVEINGGIWSGGKDGGPGAHGRPGGIENDYERHQYAARLGFFVLPFTTDEVMNKHAIDWTIETLYRHGWRP